MLYFTSDLHLGHKNILNFRNRPFKNVDEMNEQIIERFNQKVTNKDDVYILGDVCYKSNQYEMKALVNKLNGKTKTLILGNHDPKFIYSCFDEVTTYKEVSYAWRKLILFHYPILEWNGYFGHGGGSGKRNDKNAAVHLHGHQHNYAQQNIQNRKDGLFRYDVGVDANNFAPVSADEILEFFRLPRP